MWDRNGRVHRTFLRPFNQPNMQTDNASTELQLQQIAKCKYARQRLRVMILVLTPMHNFNYLQNENCSNMHSGGNVHHSILIAMRNTITAFDCISVVQANEVHINPAYLKWNAVMQIALRFAMLSPYASHFSYGEIETDIVNWYIRTVCLSINTNSICDSDGTLRICVRVNKVNIYEVIMESVQIFSHQHTLCLGLISLCSK